MKQLKSLSFVLFALIFIFSCEDDDTNNFIDSNEVTIDKDFNFKDYDAIEKLINQGFDFEAYFKDKDASFWEEENSSKTTVFSREEGEEEIEDDRQITVFQNTEDFMDESCTEMPVEGFDEAEFDESPHKYFNEGLDSNSSNHAFSPGDIVEGIVFSVEGDGDDGGGRDGRSSPAIDLRDGRDDQLMVAELPYGPSNQLTTYNPRPLVIEFTNEINLVGFNVRNSFGASFGVHIIVYGTDGVLLNSFFPVSGFNQFYGFKTEHQAITKITLSNGANNPGVWIDNVTFGACWPDSDGDGIPDNDDNCPDIRNRGQNDRDEDGVGNRCDNCPGEYNPNQSDEDEDGVGDACDVCPFGDDNIDTDEDGVPDACDNCPDVYNPNQSDIDSDGIGDVCDVCPMDPFNDADGDGVCGDVDNCPETFNPDQSDIDGDKIGDVCDPDMDGDQILNEDDNCPMTPNGNQADYDSDGMGDACDDDDDGDGIEDSRDIIQFSDMRRYVEIDNCLSRIGNVMVKRGMFMQDEINMLIDEIEALGDVSNRRRNNMFRTKMYLTINNWWFKYKLLSYSEKSDLLRCLANAEYPFDEEPR